MRDEISIFWFRRDLRLADNIGLREALNGPHPVLPLFIFDTEILDGLPEDDARVTFIYDCLQDVRQSLQKNAGSSVAIYYGRVTEVFDKLLHKYTVRSVYANRDYEPYARERDAAITRLLADKGITFHTFKDQVIFEQEDVLKEDGDPYVVYTPYMKKWKELLGREGLADPSRSVRSSSHFVSHSLLPNPQLSDMGFRRSDMVVPDYHLDQMLLEHYQKTRNFPAREGTSRLGPHLRFGTLSIRQAVRKAMEAKDETFLNELIWREFFMQILWHFPHTIQAAFKPQYDRIPWRNEEDEFEKWKTGKTGYALVDAGMRQLNATGYMHNRVRMVVASFLTKHLLIDWRWGEAYFAGKLLDYEMSSNVGNWQWSAGSGVDAAPYFRIFNPMTQAEKFDPDQAYIRKWIPEFETDSYPDMMVAHQAARERCLSTYRKALD